MKNELLIFIFLNGFLLYGQTPANDPHWLLLWEDNFSLSAINTGIWDVQDNFDHYGKQPQVYIDDNVYIEGGALVLEVKNESYSCPSWAIEPDYHCVRQYNTGQPYSFTSGMVETKQAYNTQFGYVEARIKFPYGSGLWPAFWTMVSPSVASPVSASEIDIVELIGSLPSTVMTTNIHHDYCDDSRSDYIPASGECSNIPDFYQESSPAGFNWNNQWHVYGVEWSPSKIIWYLDGVQIRTFKNEGQIDPVSGIPVYPVDPSKTILNVALFHSLNMSLFPNPIKMYTDYVKVYKLKNDCNTILNVCNYSFASYDNQVKKSITIGNGSCANTIYTGQNIHLRAAESITINGDFTMQQGAELYLDVNYCY